MDADVNFISTVRTVTVSAFDIRDSRAVADLHRTTAATTPGDKLLTGRLRRARNWTRRTLSSLFLCRKLHLFSGKSTKTATTRAALFDSNMHQVVCRLRLRLRHHLGSLQRSPNPLAVFRGDEEEVDEAGSSSFALGMKRKVGAYVIGRQPWAGTITLA